MKERKGYRTMSKNKSLAILAIFSFSFLAMIIGTTSPALASIGQAFPKVSFSVVVLVATLPALATVPFSIIGGKLAGDIMTFRGLAIISVILVTIGGIAPYFMSSFVGILFMRMVMGAGCGLGSPIPVALIMNIFEGKEIENLMGYNSIVQNMGGIVFQLLGGFLCTISWRYTFLAHLLCIIPLVIVIFLLPEPAKFEKAVGQKVKMPGMVYVWSTIFLVYEILLYPMLTGMSSLILTSNLGTAASAGVVLTMFTVGGMVTGAVFGKVYHIATKYTIVIGMLLNALGYILLIFGNSIFIFTVSSTMVGMGFGFIITSILMYVGMPVPPSAQPLAISIAIAFMSIGGFISSFFFASIERMLNITSMRFPFVLGAICLVAYSIIQTLINLKSSKTQNSQVGV